MTYSEVLNSIHSRKTFSGGGPTLDRIRRLMDRLGNPQEDFKTIHVAGTNGKGSVCAMIHAVMQNAGYRMGLFTSPYLKDFRERVRILGEMISKETLISCYEEVMEQQRLIEADGFEPINEFELVTAIGFLAFSRAKLDYVVLEVGLGGTSDPTNLIRKPAVSCIMPISLDHTSILGHTIPEISAEKAGIIKPGCPVVISRQTEEARNVFVHTADDLEAPLFEAADPVMLESTKSFSQFLYGGNLYSIPLLGGHQVENAATAIQVCMVLGVDISCIQKGLQQTRWPGRLQYFPGPPEFLVDAGHNEAGVSALCAALEQLFSGQKIIAIMAMMKDKDFNFCIPAIAKRAKLLIGTSVGLPRSLPPEQLCEKAAQFCPVETAEHMQEAISLAKANAQEGDLILICGSVYAAGDALLILEK